MYFYYQSSKRENGANDMPELVLVSITWITVPVLLHNCLLLLPALGMFPFYTIIRKKNLLPFLVSPLKERNIKMHFTIQSTNIF